MSYPDDAPSLRVILQSVSQQLRDTQAEALAFIRGQEEQMQALVEKISVVQQADKRAKDMLTKIMEENEAANLKLQYSLHCQQYLVRVMSGIAGEPPARWGTLTHSLQAIVFKIQLVGQIKDRSFSPTAMHSQFDPHSSHSPKNNPATSIGNNSNNSHNTGGGGGSRLPRYISSPALQRQRTYSMPPERELEAAEQVFPDMYAEVHSRLLSCSPEELSSIYEAYYNDVHTDCWKGYCQARKRLNLCNLKIEQLLQSRETLTSDSIVIREIINYIKNMFHKRRLSLDSSGADMKSPRTTRFSESGDSIPDVEESPRIRSLPQPTRSSSSTNTLNTGSNRLKDSPNLLPTPTSASSSNSSNNSGSGSSSSSNSADVTSKHRDIFPELRTKARGVMNQEELEQAQGVLDRLIALSTERNAVWTRLETVLRLADKDWDGTLNVPSVNNEID